MTLEKINLKQSTNHTASPTATPLPQVNIAASNKPSRIAKFIPFLIIIILGVGTGFIAFNFIQPGSQAGVSSSTASKATAGGLRVGETIGIENTEFKPDEVMGVLETGGFDGEGSHHLLRPGGKDQTVYLTSSVVDLDQFVGHKITVWGQTFSAQKAGWLMDVVRVRVEELNAPTP
jgi:hypothetical protein